MKIGFVGLGRMGGNMVKRLIEKGMMERLAPGGILLYGRAAQGRIRSIRVERAGQGVTETELGLCRLPLAATGLAERL